MIDREKVRRRAYAQRRVYRIYYRSFQDDILYPEAVPFLRGADWIAVGIPYVRVRHASLLHAWVQICRVVQIKENRAQWLKQEIADRNTYL